MLWSWEVVVLFIEFVASVTCVFVPIHFIPLYFEFIRGDRLLHAEMRLLPYIFASVTVTTLNKLLIASYYKPEYLAGRSPALVGSALMYAVNKDMPAGSVYSFGDLVTFGTGFYNQGC